MSPRLKDLERQVRDLHGMVRRLVGWRATLEDRMDKQVRHGKVTDVDTKKQLARLEIGNKDGTSLKSPWVPYAEVAVLAERRISSEPDLAVHLVRQGGITVAKKRRACNHLRQAQENLQKNRIHGWDGRCGIARPNH